MTRQISLQPLCFDRRHIDSDGSGLLNYIVAVYLVVIGIWGLCARR